MLALFACGAAEQSIPCKDDRRCLRYALSTDIPLLDPHFSHLPEAGMIFRQIYDTLVYRDGESGEFRPGLAIDWEISEDGLVYTFRLRRDVLFHDGTDFSAAAVAQNIERIFRPESEQSLARKLLAPLRQYEVLDQHTIRLRLFEP
ncbi:MAG: ABC transporter substrate-binding protein, partial [Chloroflexi bacterium]|nr:ABC transporter substrate-binding protein [Chloroflexota bacterium]